MKIDLAQVINCIFKNKDQYQYLDDEDKEKFFFMVNKIFSSVYPKQADFMNNKSFDPVIGMDTWFIYIRDIKKLNNIPSWYFKYFESVKKQEQLTTDEKEVKTKYKLKNSDILFLKRYYSDNLLIEIEKINKFK